jgi:trehalose 2-sulfotransferase
VHPKQSYFICASPRCGSTLLSEALEMTNLAGHPKEYFTYEHESYWIEKLEIASYDSYIDKIIKVGTTPNGVFGAKLFWFQTAHLAEKLKRLNLFQEKDDNTLTEIFPNLRYIWIDRDDKLRQAISYYKAIHTRVWWLIRGFNDASESTKDIDLQFDAEAI